MQTHIPLEFKTVIKILRIKVAAHLSISYRYSYFDEDDFHSRCKLTRKKLSFEQTQLY